MSRYRLRPQAQADLEAIGDYIAADSPSRAVAFVEERSLACKRLA
jgi:plasmid stabilization system protein ParE